jgi:hypothetical protein
MRITVKQLFIPAMKKFVRCLANPVIQIAFNHLEIFGQVSFAILKVKVNLFSVIILVDLFFLVPSITCSSTVTPKQADQETTTSSMETSTIQSTCNIFVSDYCFYIVSCICQTCRLYTKRSTTIWTHCF